ncbi:uncharacterized protein LOC110248227 [Exaiptasia diaphana]|uniref:Uncharacterized protein n=1 Tax=Exaiptasia diaphana TaxID=2652724 RepID=A0A913XWN4_EXADI|nr:uncharacterized protein LOC110248227 [Exaiptasia diaphana]
MIGQPVINKDLCTQTDIGCPSSLGQTTETTPQQKPFVFLAEDVKDEEDSSIDGDGIIDAMLKVLEEITDGNDAEHLVEFKSENNNETTDKYVNNKDSDGNMESEIQGGDGNAGTEHLVKFASDNNNKTEDISIPDHGQKEKRVKWSPCKEIENDAIVDKYVQIFKETGITNISIVMNNTEHSFSLKIDEDEVENMEQREKGHDLPIEFLLYEWYNKITNGSIGTNGKTIQASFR